jgi:tetratricopeptide (TPR) repeat protein
MTRASELADELEAFLPFAPMGVARIAEQERKENWHRLNPNEQERFVRLAARGRSEADTSRRPRFACAFPVVLEPMDHVHRELKGLVFEMRGGLGLPGDRLDAQPVVQALRHSPEQARLAERLIEDSDVRVYVSPHPEDHPGVTLSLKGDSLEGALYLAVMATLEGAEIPPNVVVSAGIEHGSAGMVLEGVSSLAEKHAVLERERPGCRFFCVPGKDEVLPPDSCIETIPLKPAAASKLFEAVFGRPISCACDSQLPLLLGEIDLARSEYFAQRYDEAERLFLDVKRRMDRLPDHGWHPGARAMRFEVQARLAALLLHEGHWDRAQPVLERLRRDRDALDEISCLMHAEVVADAASVRIDALDPDGAAAILEQDLGDTLADLSCKRGRLYPEERLTLVTIYGAWRRIHLLRGQVDLAVEVQDKLQRVAPDRHRARALCDLGECLHRAGQFAEAMRTWDLAERALGRVSSYYGVHTRAFLEFYRARADLISAEGSSAPRVLADLASSQLEGLDDDSAATWRLHRLGALARWVEGDHGALERLAAQVHQEERAFQRWCCGLDLVWAAKLAQQDNGPALRHAAVAFETLAVPHYPELDVARRAFCAAARRGELDEDAVEIMLARRVY